MSAKGFNVADLAFKINTFIPGIVGVDHIFIPETHDDLFYTTRSNKNLKALVGTSLVAVSCFAALASRSDDTRHQKAMLKAAGAYHLTSAGFHLRGIQTKERKRNATLAVTATHVAIAAISLAGARGK